MRKMYVSGIIILFYLGLNYIIIRDKKTKIFIIIKIKTFHWFENMFRVIFQNFIFHEIFKH